MQTFLDYGQGLAEDMGRFGGENDHTAFHIHPHYELLILLEPVKTRSIICGKYVSTDYPFAMLTAPFIPHFTNALEYSGKYKRYVLYFGNDVIDSMRLPFGMKDLTENNATKIFNITDEYRAFKRLVATYDILTTPEDKQRILEILLNLIYRKKDNPLITIKKTESYILDVIDYIIQNLDTECNAQEIANRFFVSYNKLRRDFKSYTYMGIGEFILSVKLNRAKELLKKKNCGTIAEIAKKCGWESESYFYKLFKERTGKTPLEYRHQRSFY